VVRDGGGHPCFGKSVGPLITTNVAVGGAPNGEDVPAKMLEVINDLEGLPHIFVVSFIELKGVSGSPIVDTDENRSAYSCGSEDCGDSFLYCMEFSIVYFSPIAEMAVSILQQVELLVSAVVDGPSTADSAIFQFGAIGVYDNGLDGQCA